MIVPYKASYIWLIVNSKSQAQIEGTCNRGTEKNVDIYVGRRKRWQDKNA